MIQNIKINYNKNKMNCFCLVGEFEVYVSFSKKTLIEKFISEAVIPYYERHAEDLKTNAQKLNEDTITEIRRAIKDGYYDINKEIICYNTKEELLEKVKFYLKHESEANKIREAGYLRAKREHTWERRFEQLFKEIGI